jgi:hypothetical protein
MDHAKSALCFREVRIWVVDVALTNVKVGPFYCKMGHAGFAKTMLFQLMIIEDAKRQSVTQGIE